MRLALAGLVLMLGLVACNRGPDYVGEYQLFLTDAQKADLAKLDSQVDSLRERAAQEPEKAELYETMIESVRSFPLVVEKTRVHLNGDGTFAIDSYDPVKDATSRLEGTFEAEGKTLTLHPKQENGRELTTDKDKQSKTATFDPATGKLDMGGAMTFIKI